MAEAIEEIEVMPDTHTQMPKYIFHGQDWFSRHIPVWEEHLEDILSRNIRILEIGCYEGRSTVWLLEHMTQESILACVDTWDGKDVTLGDSTLEAEKVFDHNTAPHRTNTSLLGRCRKFKQSSSTFLGAFLAMGARFDLIIIDGCHEGLSTLSDLIMSWQVLSEGGYVVFDDYLWEPSPSMGIRVTPHDAWEAFAAMKPEGMELVHQHRQCIVKKLTRG